MKLSYMYLPILIILFIVSCGITVKKFMNSDKNKYLMLFATVVLLINLIIDIV